MNEEFWSDLYGWLKFDAGCSLEEIDNMTLQDVRRLSDYAKKNPPPRLLLSWCAQALGVKLPDPPSKKSNHMSREQFKALAQATGGKVPGMGGS